MAGDEGLFSAIFRAILLCCFVMDNAYNIETCKTTGATSLRLHFCHIRDFFAVQGGEHWSKNSSRWYLKSNSDTGPYSHYCSSGQNLTYRHQRKLNTAFYCINASNLVWNFAIWQNVGVKAICISVPLQLSGGRVPPALPRHLRPCNTRVFF